MALGGKSIRNTRLWDLGNRALARIYRRGVRPFMPATSPVRYASIPIAYDHKWGDDLVPSCWLPGALIDRPSYEFGLTTALAEYVHPGDRVVVVGGGMGVTATIAASRVGRSGRVECFEGSSKGVRQVRRTAARNGVADRLRVHHAVVARAVGVYGGAPSREVVAPNELPECDVLELDCEGAEIEILREMVIRPRVVIVESHGIHGAPAALISSLLSERGYIVRERGVADPSLRALCIEQDIHVLVGAPES